MGPDRAAQSRRTPPRGRRTVVSRTTRLAVWLLGLGPAVWILARMVADDLGANPIEELTHETGESALWLLVAALAVTPARRLLRWPELARHRRAIGLFAFGYAFVHFSIYLGLDQFFAWGAIVDDVVDRPYITAGFTALVCLAPLAATSTDAMMRRLGRRWQSLHRLVYLAGVAAAVHFLWLTKGDQIEPVLWAAAVGGLLAYRLWYQTRRTRRRRARETRQATSGPAGRAMRRSGDQGTL